MTEFNLPALGATFSITFFYVSIVSSDVLFLRFLYDKTRNALAPNRRVILFAMPFSVFCFYFLLDFFIGESIYFSNNYVVKERIFVK